MLAIVERSRVSSQESAWPAGTVSPGIDAAHLTTLERWVRAPTSTQRVVTRSLIVLLSAAGHSRAAIARQLGVTRRTVALWQRRFRESGPESLLQDAPGRGRKKGREHQTVSRILAATAHERPPAGSRWTVRSLARHLGVGHATVHRVWREHGLSPAARGDLN
jgi:transposase